MMPLIIEIAAAVVCAAMWQIGGGEFSALMTGYCSGLAFSTALTLMAGRRS